MERYRDVDGDSGVEAYEIGPDYIAVKFEGSSRIYRYTYQTAGQENVERMKILAVRGNGLNSFIMRTPRVKSGYVR